jgi:hypothetical protein
MKVLFLNHIIKNCGVYQYGKKLADIYSGNYYNTQNKSRKIFQDRGYLLVFPDVSLYFNNKYSPFEDWYIHPDLVNMDLINKIKTDKDLLHNEIINVINKYS